MSTITPAPPMEITFLTDLPAWERLARPWNELLSRSATDVPFLRFEFLHAWWSTLGGGEWPDGELCVALGAERGGELAAAAPFFRTSARPKTLLFLGTAEIADYLDVVAPAAALEPFARALLDAIARGAAPSIDTLDLWNVQEASPGGVALANAAKAVGWSVERTRLKPCPQVALSGGWPAYLERLDKKQRHELRRKLRRVEQTPGTAFLRAGRDLEMTAAVEAFLGLMSLDAEKSRFLTSSMRAMFHQLGRDAGQAGWLRLELLTVDGRPAAGAMCFDYGNRLLLYNTGIDPAFHALSPGWALLGHLIQSAAEEGKTAVDFLRGDEAYKFRLGGEARYVERLTLRQRR